MGSWNLWYVCACALMVGAAATSAVQLRGSKRRIGGGQVKTTTIYLGGKFSDRAKLRGVRERIHAIEAGLVISSWLDEQVDESSRESGSRDLKEALASDLVIVDTMRPTRRGGRETELGIALGAKIDAWVVGPAVSVFHHVVPRFPTWDAALAELLLRKAVTMPHEGCMHPDYCVEPKPAQLLDIPHVPTRAELDDIFGVEAQAKELARRPPFLVEMRGKIVELPHPEDVVEQMERNWRVPCMPGFDWKATCRDCNPLREQKGAKG